MHSSPYSDIILALIDVTSLYTNISHSKGMESAVKALKSQCNPDPMRPDAEVIGKLIDIVLYNNVFEFDGKYYLQIQGCAMGTVT